MAFTSSAVRTHPGLPTGSCSLSRDEHLPGTAAQASTWVLVEHPGGWGQDILDGSAFGQSLSAELSARMDRLGGRLLLIRRPGREGQNLKEGGGSHRAYLAQVGGRNFEPAQLFAFEVSGVADLLTLPLDNPETIPGVVVSRETLVLVCAHSKRDLCCAVQGRSLAAFLQEQNTEVQIWECSHAGGHRFAPVVLTLPSGYVYGRLTSEQALTLVSETQPEKVALLGLRGRSTHTPIEQVAEITVRSYLSEKDESPGANDLSPLQEQMPAGTTVQAARVSHKDGRVWLVTAHPVEIPARPESCGADPAPATSWQIESIVPNQRTSAGTP